MDKLVAGLAVFMAMCAWSVLHSWLAAFSTKEFAIRLFGEKTNRYYRLIFIAIALVTLLPILGMVAFLSAQVLWRIPTPWVFLTLTLQVLALGGLMLTVLQVDTLAFLGLHQLEHPDAENKGVLVTRGFYRWVRHPLYFFSLVIFWLMPIMTDLTLVFIVASSLYFVVGTIPEERKLVKIHGDAYRHYQASVPRIIPWFKRRK